MKKPGDWSRFGATEKRLMQELQNLESASQPQEQPPASAARSLLARASQKTRERSSRVEALKLKKSSLERKCERLSSAKTRLKTRCADLETESESWSQVSKLLRIE